MLARQIDRFEVLREIAHTDLGEVCKALDPVNKKQVVIRTVKSSPSCDLPALLNSVRAAIELNSPNIARLFEVSVAGETLRIVSEYVEGNTIRLLLDRGDFPVWDLIDFARQCCAALDHAESRHLAHTNLTPSNLMQEWDGTIKVMDYGLVVSPLEKAQRTGSCEALRYASPEQLSGKPPDLRSNVFSLGTILYEMASGRKAFTASDRANILDSIANADPDAPHLIKPTVHPGLSRVILKSLAKAPNHRYPSGAELILALETCMKPEPSPKTEVAGAKQAPSERPKPAVSAGAKQAPSERPKPAVSVLPVRPAAAGGINHPNEPTLGSSGAPIAATRAPVAVKRPPGDTESTSPRSPTVTTGHMETYSGHMALLEIQAMQPPPVVKERREPAIPRPCPPLPQPSPVVTLPVAPKARALTPVATKWAQAGAKLPRPVLYGSVAVLVIVLGVMLGRTFFGRPGRPPDPLPAAAPTEWAAVPVKIEPVAAPAPLQDTAPPAVPARRTKKHLKTVLVAAPSASTGDVLIDSIPQGASLQIDGAGGPGLVTPYAASGLSPGAHTVTISKAGYTPESHTLQIIAGRKVAVTVSLTELKATVSVASEPEGASVIIDGNGMARVTPLDAVLPRGRHTIVVRKPGYFDEACTLESAPGQSYRFSPQLRPMGNADEVRSVGKLKRIFGGGKPRASAKLQVRTAPKGAQIMVNQRVMDQLTPAEFVLPAGNYELTLTFPARKPARRTISLVEGENLVINESLEP